MPWSSVWFWLRRLWPLWVVLLAAGLAYRAGYLKRDTAAEAEMAAVKAEWRQKQLAAELAYRAQLAAAAAEKQRWHDFAQVQSQKLAHTYARLDGQAGRMKQEIADVVQSDAAAGACVGGLGPDSLRLYRRALGY
ncbi:hypothetical protein [Neisseria shayeganii]|uniref:Uncharacterized protein n=1 Tax=Neisseria shayeganii TaxID=607712 RepID=A0A7D7N4P3_9NEIS|nr:hypothetical protein [Neisseria shayeganii]QMT39980.1 hypothetical protein H3L94_08985 [Neisseria shayeganii]